MCVACWNRKGLAMMCGLTAAEVYWEMPAVFREAGAELGPAAHNPFSVNAVHWPSARPIVSGLLNHSIPAAPPEVAR